MSPRRRSLTPLDSELTPTYGIRTKEKPGLRERFRGRRARRSAPKSLGWVIAQGLLRLGLAVAIASLLALGLDQLRNKGSAFGFYIVGAIVLALAFGMSTSGRGYIPYTWGEHDRRVSTSFAYMLAGAIVIGIGVAIEAL